MAAFRNQNSIKSVLKIKHRNDKHHLWSFLVRGQFCGTGVKKARVGRPSPILLLQVNHCKNDDTHKLLLQNTLSMALTKVANVAYHICHFKDEQKTNLLNTKMLYYFMKRVTISISNESFITFIQPAVMPSPPQTPALYKKTIGDSAG